ncbi:MAG: aminoacyl-tRNA hydrolase [Desulfuromonadales bacterium]|nr:aminoacyl-tRNA hydrolase [Desulfuromonadales bacterium]
MKLIVGLGNPGEQYAETRHNIGFMVVGRLAEQFHIPLKRKGHQGVYGVGRLGGEEVTLLLPHTFMNRSGVSVGSACQSLGVPPGDLIVVHDEIDLDFGELRVKVGGGHAGHNGLRSIRAVLGSADFVRLRAGIGRPPQGGDVAAYVLSRFTAGQRTELSSFVDTAADALQVVLRDGPTAAMNIFNQRRQTT